MRHSVFGLLYLVCVSHSYSQTTETNHGRIYVEIIKEKRSSKAHAKAEIVNAFAGGDSLWLQSFEKKLNERLQYNKWVKKGKYVVAVSFLLAKDSSLSDFRCLNTSEYGLCDDVRSVLVKGMARWAPAEQGGREVRPYSRSAITYPDNN